MCIEVILSQRLTLGVDRRCEEALCQSGDNGRVGNVFLLDIEGLIRWRPHAELRIPGHVKCTNELINPNTSC